MGKDAQIKAYLLLYVQQDDTNVKKKKILQMKFKRSEDIQKGVILYTRQSQL